MCGRQSRPPVFRHSRIPTLLWERKRAADAFTRWCRGNIFKRHALDLPSSRILLMTFPKMRGKTLSPRRPGVGQKRRAATWRPPRQAPGKGRSGFPPRRKGGRKEGRREGRSHLLGYASRVPLSDSSPHPRGLCRSPRHRLSAASTRRALQPPWVQPPLRICSGQTFRRKGLPCTTRTPAPAASQCGKN